MKVASPGKLLLTGAYAVLEGAPAIVVAVDRLAVADDALVDPQPSREVTAAFGAAHAPRVDASALFEAGAKLGLGSSAAVLVAALGARAAARGLALDDAAVRRQLFDEGFAAHGRAQGGGSGVDVAACVYGGALRYELGARPRITSVALPRGLVFAAFFSGASARTSDLRAQVDGLRARAPDLHAASFAALASASHAAASAVDADDARAFVLAADRFRRALGELGAAAEAPIVPPAFAELSATASEEGAVFLPSGAGGGDIGVFLACAPPSEALRERARALGMTALDLRLDRAGVRALSEEQPARGHRAPNVQSQGNTHG